MVTIKVSLRGTLILKSQVTDYTLQSHELECYNLFKFVHNTYEAKMGPNDWTEGQHSASIPWRHGLLKNMQSKYLKGHPNIDKKHCIVCTAGHNTLTNVIGPWFPHRDDKQCHDLYCAAMLMLLKPWHNLSIDLKPAGMSWRAAFDGFEASASDPITL